VGTPSDQKRRLRVVTLVDHLLTQGGAELFSVAVTRRLDRDRFEPIYCASRWNEERAAPDELALRDAMEADGVRFVGLRRRGRVNLLAWRPLLALLRRERVDVLHSHKFGSNVWAVILGRLARVPVIVAHEHTWSYEGQPLRKFLDRHLIARGSNAFVAVSREDERRMIAVEGIDPADVTFVPNGIDALPEGDGARVRAELGIEPDAPVIGAVAVLRPQKALDVLVRAVAELVPEHPQLRAVIAGEGRPAELNALAQELGVGDNVMLIGNRGDVPDVLAALDVAVSSSRFEGSPLAVMEYMDAALPVVATRVGGVPDLIEDGVNGLLVEPGDPGGLAAAIGELLKDPARAKAMGERGRERRRAEFDLNVTVRRLESLYEELRAASPRGEGR
jgi:glycosyltransferase involved in cell wall biosynthesis